MISYLEKSKQLEFDFFGSKNEVVFYTGDGEVSEYSLIRYSLSQVSALYSYGYELYLVLKGVENFNREEKITKINFINYGVIIEEPKNKIDLAMISTNIHTDRGVEIKLEFIIEGKITNEQNIING